MSETESFTECRTDAYTEEYDSGDLARVRVQVTWVDGNRYHYDDVGTGSKEEVTDSVESELLFERTAEKRIELTGFRAYGSHTGDRLFREHLRVMRTFEHGREVVDERTDPSFTVVDVREIIGDELNG